MLQRLHASQFGAPRFLSSGSSGSDATATPAAASTSAPEPTSISGTLPSDPSVRLKALDLSAVNAIPGAHSYGYVCYNGPQVIVPTLPEIDPAAIAASEKAGGMRCVHCGHSRLPRQKIRGVDV